MLPTNSAFLPVLLAKAAQVWQRVTPGEWLDVQAGGQCAVRRQQQAGQPARMQHDVVCADSPAAAPQLHALGRLRGGVRRRLQRPLRRLRGC